MESVEHSETEKLTLKSAIYNESYILLAGQKHPHLMVLAFIHGTTIDIVRS